MSTKADWLNRWQGQTVVCIASGPSLTQEDCELVRASGLTTVVTNTTFQLCPWAHVLFAFDCKWWKHYAGEVKAGRWQAFRGARIGWSPGVASYGVPSLHHESEWFTHFHNSGACAASLAVAAGASRVVLLGYDCQRTGGKTHWHGDHPKALGNARSMNNWPTQFKSLARYASAKGVPIENASRATALTFFPRVELARALHVKQLEAA